MAQLYQNYNLAFQLIMRITNLYKNKIYTFFAYDLLIHWINAKNYTVLTEFYINKTLFIANTEAKNCLLDKRFRLDHYKRNVKKSKALRSFHKRRCFIQKIKIWSSSIIFSHQYDWILTRGSWIYNKKVKIKDNETKWWDYLKRKEFLREMLK